LELRGRGEGPARPICAAARPVAGNVRNGQNKRAYGQREDRFPRPYAGPAASGSAEHVPYPGQPHPETDVAKAAARSRAPKSKHWACRSEAMPMSQMSRVVCRCRAKMPGLWVFKVGSHPSFVRAGGPDRSIPPQRGDVEALEPVHPVAAPSGIDHVAQLARRHRIGVGAQAAQDLQDLVRQHVAGIYGYQLTNLNRGPAHPRQPGGDARGVGRGQQQGPDPRPHARHVRSPALICKTKFAILPARGNKSVP